MPAQSSGTEVPYYAEFDTAPERAWLLRDDFNQLVDLSGYQKVEIIVAHSSYSHYYAPRKRIVDRGLCTIDPDQVTNKGRITWKPGAGQLTPAGDYQFQFIATDAAGDEQTFPPNRWLPLIIRERAGGGT